MLANDNSGLAFCSTDLGHIFGNNVGNEFEVLMIGKGHHEPERGFGALAQVIGRTAIPLLRKFFVPAAKRVGADLLEFAVPEIAEVVSGRQNFKAAAKSVGKQTIG